MTTTPDETPESITDQDIPELIGEEGIAPRDRPNAPAVTYDELNENKDN